MLIIFGGLPGVGKTTISRGLARVLRAVYLRIDSIEQPMLQAGFSVGGEGYEVGHAVAADNLRLGHVVIADCVNDWTLTRDAWRAVASRAEVRAFEVEVICSNTEEHKKRVESRIADIPGAVLPTWAAVTSREYHPWDGDHLVIDTAAMSAEQCITTIQAAIPRS